jgi:CRISPR-associated protein Cas2
MLTWVVYDISSDKTRNRVVRFCKDAGLYRVQKSVFLGDVESNRIDELYLRCEKILDKKSDSFYIFPMCRQDFDKVKTAGNAFDRELVSDEILSMFF